jgi:hypothetical protein
VHDTIPVIDTYKYGVSLYGEGTRSQNNTLANLGIHVASSIAGNSNSVSGHQTNNTRQRSLAAQSMVRGKLDKEALDDLDILLASPKSIVVRWIYTISEVS